MITIRKLPTYQTEQSFSKYILTRISDLRNIRRIVEYYLLGRYDLPLGKQKLFLVQSITHILVNGQIKDRLIQNFNKGISKYIQNINIVHPALFVIECIKKEVIAITSFLIPSATNQYIKNTKHEKIREVSRYIVEKIDEIIEELESEALVSQRGWLYDTDVYNTEFILKDSMNKIEELLLAINSVGEIYDETFFIDRMLDYIEDSARKDIKPSFKLSISQNSHVIPIQIEIVNDILSNTLYKLGCTNLKCMEYANHFVPNEIVDHSTTIGNKLLKNAELSIEDINKLIYIGTELIQDNIDPCLYDDINTSTEVLIYPDMEITNPILSYIGGNSSYTTNPVGWNKDTSFYIFEFSMYLRQWGCTDCNIVWNIKNNVQTITSIKAFNMYDNLDISSQLAVEFNNTNGESVLQHVLGIRNNTTIEDIAIEFSMSLEYYSLSITNNKDSRKLLIIFDRLMTELEQISKF